MSKALQRVLGYGLVISFVLSLLILSSGIQLVIIKIIIGIVSTMLMLGLLFAGMIGIMTGALFIWFSLVAMFYLLFGDIRNAEDVMSSWFELLIANLVIITYLGITLSIFALFNYLGLTGTFKLGDSF